MGYSEYSHGHRTYWCIVRSGSDSDYYVVTDPDIALETYGRTPPGYSRRTPPAATPSTPCVQGWGLDEGR